MNLMSLRAIHFARIKDELDDFLASRFGIAKESLLPWHYQNRYFQEAPKIHEVDLDTYYEGRDIVKLTMDFFASIDLPVTDLLEKSDLFEKEGKHQHAYCLDVDRQGDVRVVSNVKPDYNWMNTLLHEFGHAAYDKFQDPATPWLLRMPAHIFTTEAIAMLFGRLASSAAWMDDMFGLPPGEKARVAQSAFQTLRTEQLVFSRWVQVMYRFEKAMYQNPEQDLNKLWWQLVEDYQMLRKPDGRDQPDWATKIHVALEPAYYHNYMLGELLASQLQHHIARRIIKTDDINDISFVNAKVVGEYLREHVFKPGLKYHWNDMIENATGEKLTAKYFARQFVHEAVVH